LASSIDGSLRSSSRGPNDADRRCPSVDGRLPSNLVTLCGGHHRALHEGKLILHGKAPHDLAFEWRDDPARTSTWGWRSEAMVLDDRDANEGPVGREMSGASGEAVNDELDRN
jgi:hypothetical protein